MILNDIFYITPKALNQLTMMKNRMLVVIDSTLYDVTNIEKRPGMSNQRYFDLQALGTHGRFELKSLNATIRVHIEDLLLKNNEQNIYVPKKENYYLK